MSQQSLVCTSLPLVSFSDEQLDQLSGVLEAGRDDPLPGSDEPDAAWAGRLERFLDAVDQAIAEIAEPRSRRKRGRWWTSVRRYRGTLAAGADRGRRTRIAPRRLPA